MIPWHALDKKEVLKDLESSESGLSDQDVSRRLKKYGSNTLKEKGRASSFLIFLEQFKSIFIIILLLAAAFSFFIHHYIDFSVIIAIVILNSAIGFFQQYKAEKTISEMRGLLVSNVKVMRHGVLYEIPSGEIVPGDILLVSEGDKIMADCRILHENSLQVNEASLTGESFPQSKSSEKLSIDTDLADRENMLYMGTTVVRGSAKAIVVSTGMGTEFGRIASLVQESKIEKTPLQQKLDSFSKILAVIILALAAILVVFGIFMGESVFNMILTGTALAISVIPEGIPAIIAITLALAIRRMQKHNSLIRKLPAAETLGRVTVICTDKTGTITEEEMTVTEVYSDGKSFRIENDSFYLDSKKADPSRSKGLFETLRIGALCNNARIEMEERKERIIGDPTEKALVISAYKAGIIKKSEAEKESRIIEYSFSSKRKMMSIVRKDSQYVSYVKGAPDSMLQRCSFELINGKVIALTAQRRREIHGEYERMASKALRVLGFAYRPLNSVSQESAESNLIFTGLQGMMDPPRKEVKESLRECLNAGINVKMVTGDSLLTAEAVSEMIGLDGKSIDAKQLEKLSQDEFDRAVMEKNIFARITPELKLKIVQSLKKQKEIVAVTGDGVNDVLALKEAHIGIAMGKRGTDVARDVSDIILLDDNFSSIVQAVREGRRVYDNIKKSIKAHLSANGSEIFVVMFALLMAWPLPLLPLAILWMNLITDSLPTLALAVEKEEPDIMKRKPRRDETILNGMVKFLIIGGIFSFSVTTILFALYYPTDLEKARTVALTTLVFCEMFIILSCRSDKAVNEIGFFSNKFLIGAILIAIGLQMIAIYTPLAAVFGFKALSLHDLGLIVLVSAPIFALFEMLKMSKIKI